MTARQPGVAFVLAIVVLLLIEAMAAAMLAMATQSRLVVDSQIRTAEADAAALTAVQTVLQNWASSRFDTIPVGSTVRHPAGPLSPGTVVTATVKRLTPAMWLVRSSSRVGQGSVFSLGRTAAIARTLDTAAARIELPTDSIPLGGLTWRQIQDVADWVVGGQVLFNDSSIVAPLVYAPADLGVGGGFGRGVLVVKGDLTIQSDAVFEGLIVAGGEVVVENGALVLGAIRSRSGVVRGDGAVVEGSESVIQAVLAATPARLRVVSEVRRYIQAF